MQILFSVNSTVIKTDSISAILNSTSSNSTASISINPAVVITDSNISDVVSSAVSDEVSTTSNSVILNFACIDHEYSDSAIIFPNSVDYVSAHSNSIFPILNSVILDSASFNSIGSNSIISDLVNFGHSMNSAHHSTSDNLASIGYDDAFVQEFSQAASAQLKLTEAILRLALSILEPPTLELKLLLENLKCAFLAPNEKLPVIIAKDLQPEQEEKLLNILRQNVKAIGWTLADIPEIRPPYACTEYS